MVFKQLRLLKEQGFEIDFVSMSEISDADMLQLSGMTSRIVVRRSFGRDFGAWKDVFCSSLDRYLACEELLLINDSVLGPIKPLGPLFDAMRADGLGVYGLTDSPAFVPHLQSYFLLFRGKDAIESLGSFFHQLKLTMSKELTIERGELGLSRFLAKRVIRVRTLYSYSRLERCLLEKLEDMEELVSVHHLVPREDLPDDEENSVALRRFRLRLSNQLLRHALNPVHYFWQILVRDFDFPFIKTELLILNPECIPGVRDWSKYVGSKSPVSVQEIKDHLEMMRAPLVEQP